MKCGLGGYHKLRQNYSFAQEILPNTKLVFKLKKLVYSGHLLLLGPK